MDNKCGAEQILTQAAITRRGRYPRQQAFRWIGLIALGVMALAYRHLGYATLPSKGRRGPGAAENPSRIWEKVYRRSLRSSPKY
jgi:hypothetical protein